MIPVLEAVPNFSEGRDPALLEVLVEALSGEGAEVLDASMDPDHHRSVVTLIGTPAEVEGGLLAAARVALDRIDLRRHQGCHPRVGALDVCPLVPLRGLGMDEAVDSAHRVGRGLAELGIPVYWYGAAADDPERGLADLRRGGVEALLGGWPPGRRPELDAGRNAAHPTAGVSCVGVRPLLLAWNLWVQGIEREPLTELAGRVRERGGGIPGLRALALELPRQEGLQLSMNLEDVERRDPFGVFRRLEEEIEALGGEVVRTEVIGMIPGALVFPAAVDRLGLSDPDPERLLLDRVQRHLLRRIEREAAAVADWVLSRGGEVPPKIRDAAGRLVHRVKPPPIPGDDA